MRIGIDLGGTKIESLALSTDGLELKRIRIASPRHDYAASVKATGKEVAEAALHGDLQAHAALRRLEDRIARGVASVVHVLDPDVIVIGGGLSRLDCLYQNLPRLLECYGFGGGIRTPIVPALHGDSSGVRGAAWLWSKGN